MENRTQYGQPVFGKVVEPFPIVSTKHGKVVGKTIDQVAVFRGIPYGDRCDRDRRFLPPKEVKNWAGVKDCTKNAPISIQNIRISPEFYGDMPYREKLGVEFETQDENSLNLNVLTPGLDDKKRPVLVYMHGGGYWQLSGTILLGADKLAREQDVVLVSVNHRLHFFGYLYLGALDERYRDSGNVGHLDLILALNWIKNNIAAFGGDPDCVTIMGESGGADKVNTLLHMPEAQGLFHRAISLSCHRPIGRLSTEEATEYTLKVLKLLNVEPNHLDKLLELPARHMIDCVFAEGTGFWAMEFGPVADNIHLSVAPGRGFVPIRPYGNVPVIFGSSEDEMATFFPEISIGVNESNFREKLLEYGIHYGLSINESNVDTVIDTYKRTNERNDTIDQLFMKIFSVATYQASGAYYQAEAYAQDKRSDVYHYLNRYDVPIRQIPDKKFAAHCIDLSPAFRMPHTTDMEDYSKTIAAAYAAFMRDGDPSTKELHWPAFDIKNKYTMIYDTVFHVKSDPLKDEREVLEIVNLKRLPIDPFWEREVKPVC